MVCADTGCSGDGMKFCAVCRCETECDECCFRFPTFSQEEIDAIVEHMLAEKPATEPVKDDRHYFKALFGTWLVCLAVIGGVAWLVLR